jgi:hypothetical protein
MHTDEPLKVMSTLETVMAAVPAAASMNMDEMLVKGVVVVQVL